MAKNWCCFSLSVDEYNILIAALMAADVDDKATITILLLGDPGCGKSTFLSYVYVFFILVAL